MADNVDNEAPIEDNIDPQKPTKKLDKKKIAVIAVFFLLLAAAIYFYRLNPSTQNEEIDNTSPTSSTQETTSQEVNEEFLAELSTRKIADNIKNIKSDRAVGIENGFIQRDILEKYDKSMSFLQVNAQLINERTVVVFYIANNARSLMAHDVYTHETYEILREKNPIMDFRYSEEGKILVYYSLIPPPYNPEDTVEPTFPSNTYGEEHVLKAHDLETAETFIIHEGEVYGGVAFSENGQLFTYKNPTGQNAIDEYLNVYNLKNKQIVTKTVCGLCSDIQWRENEFITYEAGAETGYLAERSINDIENSNNLTPFLPDGGIYSYAFSADMSRVYLNRDKFAYYELKPVESDVFVSFDGTEDISSWLLKPEENGIIFKRWEDRKDSNITDLKLYSYTFDGELTEIPFGIDEPDINILGWNGTANNLLIAVNRPYDSQTGENLRFTEVYDLNIDTSEHHYLFSIPPHNGRSSFLHD